MKTINVTRFDQRAKKLINEIDLVIRDTHMVGEELPNVVEMTKDQFISLLPHYSYLIAPQEHEPKEAVKNHRDYILYTPTAVMEVRIKRRGLW